MLNPPAEGRVSPPTSLAPSIDKCPPHPHTVPMCGSWKLTGLSARFPSPTRTREHRLSHIRREWFSCRVNSQINVTVMRKQFTFKFCLIIIPEKLLQLHWFLHVEQFSLTSCGWTAELCLLVWSLTFLQLNLESLREEETSAAHYLILKRLKWYFVPAQPEATVNIIPHSMCF